MRRARAPRPPATRAGPSRRACLARGVEVGAGSGHGSRDGIEILPSDLAIIWNNAPQADLAVWVTPGNAVGATVRHNVGALVVDEAPPITPRGRVHRRIHVPRPRHRPVGGLRPAQAGDCLLSRRGSFAAADASEPISNSRVVWLTLGVLSLLAIAVVIGTGAGRDAVALRAGQLLAVEQVVAARSTADRLYAYRVRVSTSGGAAKYVLAPSQDAVASAVISHDGEAAAVDCLLGPYRIVRRGNDWTVAMLPAWLSWLGQEGDHVGDQHATVLDALLLTSASVPQAHIFAALLASEVVMVNVEVLRGEDGPRVRLPVVSMKGRDVIPVFTSERYVPADPGLRLSRHPFRLLLEVMRPPRAPVVINPRSTTEYWLEPDAITNLQHMMGTTP